MDEKNYFGNQVGNPTLDPGPSDVLGRTARRACAAGRALARGAGECPPSVGRSPGNFWDFRTLNAHFKQSLVLVTERF